MVSIRQWRRVQHQGVVIMSLLSCASRWGVRRRLAITAALATAGETRCFTGGAAPHEIGLIVGRGSVLPDSRAIGLRRHFIVRL
jgi:hypothetical protein